MNVDAKRQEAKNVASKLSWEHAREAAKAPELALPSVGARLSALQANGFGAYLLPLIPVNKQYRRWNRVSRKYEVAIATGKSPGVWDGSSWEHMKRWTQRRAAESDIEAMKSWPDDTGIGLQTGNVIAFDIDVKVSPSSTAPAAVEARALIADIESIVAARLEIAPADLPRRGRATSTSIMLFARMANGIYRPTMSLRRGDERYAIEFMGAGRQVVVSGRHSDGGIQISNLPNWQLTNLPLLTEADVDELFADFKLAAEARGYEVDVKDQRSPKSTQDGRRDPVFTAVMARKEDWLAELLNLDVSQDLPFRLTRHDLDRDLEEDLLLDTASIWDFGTRRSHDPISLICEFGQIDAEGAISYGGAPDYVPGNGEVYLVKEDVFDTVRRPTAHEATTWLCRRLGGDAFPEYIGSTDWQSVSGTVAKALGTTLDQLAFAHVFEFAEWSELGGAPEDWSSNEIERSGGLLFALRIANPSRYERLQEHWASRPAEAMAPAEVDQAINQAQVAEVDRHKQEQSALLAGISVVRGAINAPSIPIREYVIEPRLLVGDFTQIVGEPAVSKSSLALLDAIRIAAYRPDIRIGDEQLHRGGPVIVYNAEDRLDEMRRRLTALQTHYRVSDTPHPIILWSGVDGPTLKILKRGSGNNGSLERAPGADFLEDMIRRHQPVLVCLDPQVSLLAGALENSNDDINDLYQEVANIAAKHSTSIQIIHHTSKATRDNAGDMGAGRGGFAAAGKARVVYTLTNATGKAEDEKQWGISPSDNLIRLDSAKMNHSARSRAPTLLRRRSVPVGNGHGLPLATAAALYAKSPRQILEATGDFAPVLEVVNVDELRLAEAAVSVDDEVARKIACAVSLVMGDLDECRLVDIVDTVGERLANEGVTKAKTRQKLVGTISNALLGKGVLIERDGQNVLLRAAKNATLRQAPWVITRRTMEVGDA